MKSTSVATKSSDRVVPPFFDLLNIPEQTLLMFAVIHSYRQLIHQGDIAFASSHDVPLLDAVGSKLLVIEADGDIDITIGDASGAATYYLVLVMPSGELVVSDAITFAA